MDNIATRTILRLITYVNNTSPAALSFLIQVSRITCSVPQFFPVLNYIYFDVPTFYQYAACDQCYVQILLNRNTECCSYALNCKLIPTSHNMQHFRYNSEKKINFEKAFTSEYKSEGRGFDPRWCHWNFSLT